MTTPLNLKAIFGIKLKRLREARRYTLTDLGGRASLSASYLAEIESGKKYPKAERVLQLAEALGCRYDDLISTSVDPEFDALQGFLGSPGVRDFPFEMFGVSAGDLLKILSRSPAEVTALLRTLNDMARQYNITVEHFLHAALRSFQELTGNYYEEIEAEAERFTAELGILAPSRSMGKALRHWITTHAVSGIDETAIGQRTALRQFRAVRLAEPRAELLLNPALTESQKAFVLAREAGYVRLRLGARSLTTPPDREDSFEQVLNDFKASYFAGAVLLPRTAMAADVRKLFRQPSWHAESLLRLFDKYDVTAETLMYRLSQIVPGEFGLRVHFLKFTENGGPYRLVKQLNLSELPVPPGHAASEHYCRRWLTTRLLQELGDWQHRHPKKAPHPVIGVQLSRFTDGTDEFFCMGLAQPMPLRPKSNVSLTLGFRVDPAFTKAVKFAQDRTIPHTIISTTCERCPLDRDACRDRVAPPTVYQANLARQDRARELELLRQER